MYNLPDNTRYCAHSKRINQKSCDKTKLCDHTWPIMYKTITFIYKSMCSIQMALTNPEYPPGVV